MGDFWGKGIKVGVLKCFLNGNYKERCLQGRKQIKRNYITLGKRERKKNYVVSKLHYDENEKDKILLQQNKYLP